jgi:hypothetical protein
MAKEHEKSVTPAQTVQPAADAAVHPGTPTPEGYISPEPQIGAKFLEDLIFELESWIRDFMKEADIDTNMTGRERMRLFGVKSRHYGFINKAWDIARDNPAFQPSNFSMSEMAKTMRLLEQVRHLSMIVEQLRQLVDDYLLLTCDTAYRDALRIYGNLREQSSARVAGADALFQELKQYFTLHRRRKGEAEPTEHELERDFRSLIHGHKDGEIIVQNVSPRTVEGVHKVIDNVHSGHIAGKAIEQFNEKE